MYPVTTSLVIRGIDGAAVGDIVGSGVGLVGITVGCAVGENVGAGVGV